MGKGFLYIVGIDEVGRGPIAGPLCVGVCALARTHTREFFSMTRGIKDSKQLTNSKRAEWVRKLKGLERAGCVRLATVFVGEQVIDRNGMAAALSQAVRRALRLSGVPPKRSFVMLDGTLRAPDEYLFQASVIGGDEADPLIASASLIAKVRRDLHMINVGRQFPEYGFEKHKGYGTREHYQVLKKHGVCPVHRKSFLKGLPGYSQAL